MTSQVKDTVSSIMSRTVRTIGPDETIEVALRKMAEYDIGCLIIVKDGAPIGVVTERDVVRKIIGKGWKGLGQRIFDIASKPVIKIPPEMETWKAFTMMLRRKIRRLPVEDDGKLVGLVSERDLFKWVVRVFYEPNIPEDFKKLVAQNP